MDDQLTVSDPFAQKYPEAVDSTLTSSSSCVKFNPTGPFAGHYLASGGSDGTVEVWSVETRGLVRVLEGHVKNVTSLSYVPAEACLSGLTFRWSRNNRYLATASADSSVIIWDLSVLPNSLLQPSTPLMRSAKGPGSSTARLHTIRFDAPVSGVQFHPRNAKVLLVTLSVNEVVLVDLRVGGGKTRIEDQGEEVIPPEGAEEGMQVDMPERKMWVSPLSS